MLLYPERLLNSKGENNIVDNSNGIKDICTNSMFLFDSSINFANLNLSLLDENSNINNNDFVMYLNMYLSYMPLVSKLSNGNNIKVNKEIISKVIDNIAIKSGIMIEQNGKKSWLIPISFVDKVLFQYFNLKTYNYNLLDNQYYELVIYDNSKYLKLKKDNYNRLTSDYNFVINDVIYDESQQQIISKGIISQYQIGYGTDSNYYNKDEVYNLTVTLNKQGNIVTIDYTKK